MIANEINIAVYTEVPLYIGKIYPPVYLYRTQGKENQLLFCKHSCMDYPVSRKIITLHYHARWAEGIAFPPTYYDKIIP